MQLNTESSNVTAAGCTFCEQGNSFFYILGLSVVGKELFKNLFLNLVSTVSAMDGKVSVCGLQHVLICT